MKFFVTTGFGRYIEELHNGCFEVAIVLVSLLEYMKAAVAHE